MMPVTLPRLSHGPVVLRAFAPRDVPLVTSGSTDPLIPLITTVPTSGEHADAVAFIERQHARLASGAGYSFAIADAGTDRAVGQIGLWTRDLDLGRATVGYWVTPLSRRRGYVTAALRAVTTWAESLEEVRRLQLFVEPWNEGSWRAAEACGYRREGLLRRWERVGTELRDMYAYGFLPGADSCG